jgi:hypothetical protein
MAAVKLFTMVVILALDSRRESSNYYVNMRLLCAMVSEY